MIDLEFHNVCIVGAGPGGTFTALHLAKLGIPSILVEKFVFPRDKVCGESIPSVAINRIHNLNPSILNEPEFVDSKEIIYGVNLYAPNNKKLFIPFNSNANQRLGLDSCIGIRRLDFDNVLMRYAKKEELITVKENTEIRRVDKVSDGFILYSSENEPILKTKLLVVANGFNSNLTKQLSNWSLEKDENAVGITCYYKNVEGASNSSLAECYILNGLQSGGLYIQPVGNGVVNVNISIHSDVRKKYGVNIRNIMEYAIKNHPVLKHRFENAIQIRKPYGHGYHLGIKKRPVCGDNFLLVGDAAGFNDALTANGIGHALKSAELASEIIEKALKQGNYSKNILIDYEIKVYKLFNSVMLIGKIGTWVMKYPKLIFLISNSFFGYSWMEELAYEVMYSKRPILLLFKMPFRWSLRSLNRLFS